MDNLAQARFWAGPVSTGCSCYFIQHQHTRILLDCGIKKEGSGKYPLLAESEVSRLDAVFLSHAHEDHSMAIPLLYKLGYAGKVWTTRATALQLPAYFTAWKNVVKNQAGDLPYSDHNIRTSNLPILKIILPQACGVPFHLIYASIGEEAVIC